MAKFKLELEWEAADSLVVAVLKDSVRNLRSGNRKCYTHPEDIKYQKEYIAAVKKVLHHFGDGN